MKLQALLGLSFILVFSISLRAAEPEQEIQTEEKRPEPTFVGLVSETGGATKAFFLTEGAVLEAGKEYELAVVRRIDLQSVATVVGMPAEEIDTELMLDSEEHSWTRSYECDGVRLKFRAPPQSGNWRVLKFQVEWKTPMDGFNIISFGRCTVAVR